MTLKNKKTKVICVTGTPGTGKTTLGKRMAKVSGYSYLDVNEIIKSQKLHEGYDRSRKTYIVDILKLKKFIGNIIRSSEKGLVIDSHLSHYLSQRLVDVCIVCRCDIKVLSRRLKKRGYGKAKIRENLDAEIFDTIYLEALKVRHHVISLYTGYTKGLTHFWADFDKFIKGKKGFKKDYNKRG